MIIQRVRQAVKYGTAGALVGGSVYMLRKNDWEMSTVGVVRFGRAAAAAVSIVVDYKWNLRNIDPESKEYEVIKSQFLIHRVAWVFPDFQYVWLAEETKKNLPKELDFLKEGEHCERAAKMFSHFDFLKVPKVYWELSSERVLTMEYCEGGKVDDREYMRKHKIDVNEISRNLGKLYSEMIFVNGYVHCDPHPGNVLVNKTKQGTKIVLLDHGLYQTLTDDFRINYCKLWMSIIQTNLKGIEKYSKNLNIGRLYPLFACMLTARSWEAVTHGIDTKEVTDQEKQEIQDNAAVYFIEISQILNSIPRQMLLIMKTNDVLRGIEAALQTRANASSFINMSKCCIRALGSEKLRHCNGFFQTFGTRMYTQWQLARVEIYELFLWLRTSVIVRWLTKNKQLTAS